MSASLGEAVGDGDSDGFFAALVGDGSAVAEASAVAGALDGALEAVCSSAADSSAGSVCSVGASELDSGAAFGDCVTSS
ncbi:hypothetical protein ACTXJG_11730 [Glutamicibacter arilaitensis]|uniref:hypothetical protein n=1 Tax=Glutamicibacter arilaitensis TaxID=256701 RepID=UPI003FD087C0